jgi:Flp pilus assembly protein TadD
VLSDWRTWIAGALLATAVVVALRPCLDNALTRDLADSSGSPWRQAINYPPLAEVCRAAEHTLWDASPRGYHAVSLALHGLNTILVYLLTILLATAARRASRCGWPEHLAAFVAALLFGLHPLRVEAVAWAGQRGLQVSTFFLLLSLIFYTRGACAVSGAKWWLPSGVCYLLSLAAGSVGVPLPLVLFVLDWFQSSRVATNATVSRRALVKLPFIVLAVAAVIFRVLGGASTTPNLRLPEYILVGTWNAVAGGWQTIWPDTLVPLHELIPPLGVISTQYLGGLAAVVVALVVAAACARRAPGVTAGLVTYLLMALPAAALLGDGTEQMADRFTYLPAIAIAVGVGCGLAWLAAARDDTRRVWAGVLLLGGVAAAGALGVQTWRQCYVWRTPVTLWDYALEHEPREGPHSARVRFELARACAALGQTERAAQHYHAATLLRPDLLAARFGLADMLLEELRGDDALDVLRKAVAAAPQAVEARYRLGTALAMCGQLAEAEQELRAAIELDPSSAPSHAALGHLLLIRERAPEAVSEFRTAAAIDTGNADLQYDLARAYLLVGQREPARTALRRALELDPHHEPARRTLAGLTD